VNFSHIPKFGILGCDNRVHEHRSTRSTRLIKRGPLNLRSTVEILFREGLFYDLILAIESRMDGLNLKYGISMGLLISTDQISTDDRDFITRRGIRGFNPRCLQRDRWFGTAHRLTTVANTSGAVAPLPSSPVNTARRLRWAKHVRSSSYGGGARQ
jgi:hypothetical protein